MPYLGQPSSTTQIVEYVDSAGVHSGKSYFVKAGSLANIRAAAPSQDELKAARASGYADAKARRRRGHQQGRRDVVAPVTSMTVSRDRLLGPGAPRRRSDQGAEEEEATVTEFIRAVVSDAGDQRRDTPCSSATRSTAHGQPAGDRQQDVRLGRLRRLRRTRARRQGVPPDPAPSWAGRSASQRRRRSRHPGSRPLGHHWRRRARVGAVPGEALHVDPRERGTRAPPTSAQPSPRARPCDAMAAPIELPLSDRQRRVLELADPGTWSTPDRPHPGRVSRTRCMPTWTGPARRWGRATRWSSSSPTTGGSGHEPEAVPLPRDWPKIQRTHPRARWLSLPDSAGLGCVRHASRGRSHRRSR